MKLSDEWWTSPQQSENGRLVMVTGRDDMEKVIAKGKYRSRVDVDWKYNSLPDGMPEAEDAALMDEATEAFKKEFGADPVAILTGIYTGDGERNWVFYTHNLRLFGIVFNRALENLPTIPLTITAADDPTWEEYLNMKSISYIPPEGED